MCRSSVSTATRRRPTPGLNGIFPTWESAATKAVATKAAAYNPTLAEVDPDRCGFTYKGST
jgi:hypothetical protein